MGCLPSVQGPHRMYSVADETTALRTQVAKLQTRYYESATAPTSSARNEIIAERMAAIDAYYYQYEAALTHERQDVGFLSALANIGLTSTATLVPVVQTKNLLTGISTGLQGGTKAYSDEVLFQKTVQVLQAQMHANRATVAAQIIDRMKLGLDRYPLAMAMSDLEDYYAAGTLTAALIGANKTVGDEAAAAESKKADAVLRFKFGEDNSTKLLFNYVYPDGINGKRDEARAARLVAFLRARGINTPLAVVLYDPSAASVRSRLAKDAGLLK